VSAAEADIEALVLHDITKRYAAVVANDRVSLRVRRGTIHALVGENGAGKSTLAHVAYGLVLADSGTVTIEGRALGRGGPRAALGLGLGLVHQHFMLVPTLTVAENVSLGYEPHRGAWLDRAVMAARVRDAAHTLGFELDPDARAGDLSVGEQQRVEIVRALARGARTLVLDEPTAVLTAQEVDDLFRVLRAWVARGHAVVLVSHRLSEVRALADTITVMRAGRVVAERAAGQADAAELAELIVGRRMAALERRPGKPGAVALALEDVHTAGERDALRGVSLTVRAGEIVGVAGVLGNGQQGLVRAVVGLESTVQGAVRFDGEDVAALGVSARRARGLAYVPEDRLEEGLVPDLSLAENLLLAGRAPEFDPWGRLDRARLQVRASASLAEYDVRPRDATLPARALSGGNQQRLILARELGRMPRWLVLAQPTRGVDVGGAAFLHARILAARDAGAAVLLVSADLDEILLLADRIVVLYAGRVADTLDAAGADARRLGVLMTGGART